MTFNLRNYQEQPDAILDINRYEVGLTLQSLTAERDRFFFIRDMNTNQVAEVITKESIPAFEEQLRRAFHLERFVGIVPAVDQQERS